MPDKEKRAFLGMDEGGVLADETYLHGVRILGDCYGEDIFLTIVGGENHV